MQFVMLWTLLVAAPATAEVVAVNERKSIITKEGGLGSATSPSFLRGGTNSRQLSSQQLAALGDVCIYDDDCSSGRCESPSGYNERYCYPQLENNEKCNESTDCSSGYCHVDPAEVAISTTCGIRTGSSTRCNSDSQCKSGRCDNNGGTCIAALVDGERCTSHSDCESGRCGVRESTHTGGVTNQILECVAKLSNFERCQSNNDCKSGVCDTDVDNCVPPLENWQPCSEDYMCASGICDDDGTCGLPNDSFCGSGTSNDDSCKSHNCENLKCAQVSVGDSCEQDVDCTTGRCEEQLCYEQIDDGDIDQFCDEESDCKSGNCFKGTCGTVGGISTFPSGRNTPFVVAYKNENDSSYKVKWTEHWIEDLEGTELAYLKSDSDVSDGEIINWNYHVPDLPKRYVYVIKFRMNIKHGDVKGETVMVGHETFKDGGAVCFKSKGTHYNNNKPDRVFNQKWGDDILCRNDNGDTFTTSHGNVY